ncbi:MAG: DUF4139 domain-containing protein [Terriglobales bacterium]
MRKLLAGCLYMLLIALCASAQSKDAKSDAAAQAPSLTIYNQFFAVVRQAVPLDLKAGVNHVVFSDITAHVEPESVQLRDANGGLQVLEQNYRNDPISESLLLSLFEGKTIDFVRPDRTVVKGRIVRSGYVPHYDAYQRYGSQYAAAQMARTSGGAGQPIIEVDGRLQFSLPGQPHFPALGEDTILKPTLDWQLQAADSRRTVAELSYVSGGMGWHADYNVVAPENRDVADITGWVTLENQSGKAFENARIRLMAGDVRKIQSTSAYDFAFKAEVSAGVVGEQVTERVFDEYHLYTLPRPTTLRDRETKQVEFLRATGVQAQRLYVYDGLRIEPQYQSWGMESIRDSSSYGTRSNPKVWVMFEFKNSQQNHLGMPLPAGRVRFYRRDAGGQLEFTGEDKIDHTAKDETVRLYTGNAFDVVGERRRTAFRSNSSERWADESFEITLRNHKTSPVEVRVVEHLYRWTNWDITQKSQPFQKTDAQTIEFRVQVPPSGESKVAYTVHYSW